MVYHEQFRRAAIERGIPEDEVGRFAEFLRFAIWTGTSPNGVDDVPVGKWGGLPRLPVDMEWPSTGGVPLPFVFSVDLAALPGADGSELPADGTLLFFLEHEKDHLDCNGVGEERFARVVHVKGGTETAVAEEPDHDGQPFHNTTIDFVAAERDLFATLAPDLPPWFPPGEDEEDEFADEDDLSPFQEQLLRDLERDVPHLEELRALADELWPDEGGLPSAVIGEYVVHEVIKQVAEQTLAGREKAGEISVPVAKWPTHLEREQHRQTYEWLCLARFRLADELYGGSFVMRRADLAAARFDQALPVTDFTE